MTAPIPNGRPDQPPSLPLRAALGGLRRGFASLGVRNYRLYWSGQVVSLMGTWMQQVSLPWLVLALGGSPFQLGIVAALQHGPALVLAPFGGVLADRVDKRRLLVATQLAAAAQALVLFLLTVSGIVEIPMVVGMALWLGVVNAVDMPVRQSLAPDLVPRDLLPNAIALNSMAFNSARVVGPAVAGVIIAVGAGLTGSDVTGVAVNLAINTLTYSAVIAALLRMDPSRIRRQERPERHPPVLESLKEGFLYAVRTPLVRWCLVLLGGIGVFGMNFQILLPLMAQDVLRLGAEGYGALFAAMGVGSLTGSLALAFMRQRRAVPLMLGGGTLFATLILVISMIRNVWILAPVMALTGFFSMLMINTINATVQANVTDALRGRVMSFYVTVFAGSAPIGGLIAGALAEAAGAPFAFAVGGAVSLVILVVVALGLRAAAQRGPLGVTRLGTEEQPSPPGPGGEPRAASAAR